MQLIAVQLIRLAGILFIGSQVSSASAGIMVSNLPENPAGPSAVNGPLGGAEAWTAVRFTIGAGTWQFNGLTARISEGSVLNPDGIIIEVRGDGGAAPTGVVLGSLSTTSDFSGEAEYTFAPNVAFSLAGGASYWLVARPVNNASLYAWMTTLSGTDNGVAGWSLADTLVGSPDSGTSWSIPLPAVPLLSIDAAPDSAAVPEPATATLVVSVIAAVAYRRRRV